MPCTAIPALGPVLWIAALTSIFVLPPSMEALEARLKSRGQDSPEVIARRVAAAREEMSHVSEFNYVIINQKLDEALRDFSIIIRAERLRMVKQLIRYHDLIVQLE